MADPGIHNLPFVEALFADYARDPASVPAEWRRFFQERGPVDGFRPGPSFRSRSIFDPGTAAARPPRGDDVAALQDRVDQLVRAFRVRGHMIAAIDPLGMPRPPQPDLDPAFYGLTERDLARTFSASTIGLPGGGAMSLARILETLRNTYCRSIGVQYMHIDDIGLKRWLQERMEGTENRLALGKEKQLRILKRLTDATVFEEFVQTKWLGAKSFSLEGAESLIPLLELAFEKGGDQGLDEIVVAMAHRGRLNVLANVMGKRPRDVFREFEDTGVQSPGAVTGLKDAGGAGRPFRGDVKYHLGFSHDWVTAAGRTVHLSLCFNPSHLEFVNPVALGRVRAKQDHHGDVRRERGMALLVHGDAAFAGEGVSQETLNLSQLAGYGTGGTLHVVLNNQIGFTTPPEQARSTVYATDVAKMLQSPIFHVNGEDPEAVAQVVELAMDFRRAFRRDVVVDMYCYRKRGHNEGDEPAFTQPLLYRAIAERRPVRERYLENLLAHGGVTKEEADALAARQRERLESELAEARRDGAPPVAVPSLGGIWTGYAGGADRDVPEAATGVPRERLSALLLAQTRLPEGFHPHPKIARAIEQRRRMARGEARLDWGAAESLAFASLVVEGHRVRVSGQDTERGTFSHRHAVLHDVEDGKTFVPLAHVDPRQAPFEIVNSPLSEIGVLGFEYGYSLDAPASLTVWEAQFGDFVNVAQVIVDQFIASAEEKWRRLSGLVLFLPHGFEGMGPEHSSGRLERFLDLAAADNLQVCVPSTPAQLHHLLRRQVLRPWRKPLVVFTPKSLLRLPQATSSLDELAAGGFRRIIGDPEAKAVSRVVLCAGKLYYELAARRAAAKREGVAIVRLEQLFPLAPAALEEALAPFGAGTPAVWAQEEPENMGAATHLRARFGPALPGGHPFSVVARPASSSPATGSAAGHRIEQESLLERALG